MNVTEILQFVDGLVYQHTGKHLDDVQKAVVEGAYQGETYSEIGKNNKFNTNHLSDIGGDLWKLLSEILGEDLKKSNFRSTLERVYINSSQNPNIFGNNNLILQTINQPSQQDQQNINIKSKSSYHDLKLAPKIVNFYQRESELTKLDNAFAQRALCAIAQQTPLISVLGLSGIGKTALVKRFVDLNLEQFEVIIWKSLNFPKSLDLLVNDLLNVCQEEAKEILDDKLTQFFNLLNKKRCLIILDNVENIFTTGQIAGQYKTEYQDYQKFFTMITETQHQSNIILISQEKCVQMHCLDQLLYPIKSLELSGLDDINILENTGLNNQDSWLKLIQFYEGNLTYLKDIVSLIQDVYDGEVADFLTENSLIITQNMQSHFNELFNRLSPIEQQIILELSKLDQPRSREDLKQNLPLSSVDFVKGLQSLQQRYLVTKIKEDKIMFKMSPFFREYVRNC
jgi:NB-ARC domain